ncbi:hypothetical protein CSUI_010305 [Cystoisospora suis]|uniref:Uncharacterized protein n=1 Tax=Cystoisospora suis TaxID=483139 RepID=A0A2C6KH73_9APIC|nr:hypothetical protein CSUI_010305 [Cystoisospora suis]
MFETKFFFISSPGSGLRTRLLSVKDMSVCIGTSPTGTDLSCPFLCFRGMPLVYKQRTQSAFFESDSTETCAYKAHHVFF